MNSMGVGGFGNGKRARSGWKGQSEAVLVCVRSVPGKIVNEAPAGRGRNLCTSSEEKVSRLCEWSDRTEPGASPLSWIVNDNSSGPGHGCTIRRPTGATVGSHRIEVRARKRAGFDRPRAPGRRVLEGQ